jgi:hypothetical protein
MLVMAGAVRADTIVTSGGYVTGINGITVAGTTYNVTWGSVDDTTFATSLTNATAMTNAIVADLNLVVWGLNPAVTDPVSHFITGMGVDGGVSTTVAACCYGAPPWVQLPVYPTGLWAAYVSPSGYGYPGEDAWDEFSVASVATPEPGTLTLSLTGLGLLGLMVVIRKRIVQGRAQAT